MMLGTIASILWIVAVVAYLIWEFETYSGLYRWLAELQLSYFGKYDVNWTGFVPLFVLTSPALAYLGRRYRRQNEMAAPEPDPLAARESRARKTLPWVALASVVLLAISGGAFLIGRQQAIPDDAAPVAVDLSDLRSVPDGLVSIRGDVRTDRAIVVTNTSRQGVDDEYYAPIVPTGLRSDTTPVAVFVRRATRRRADQPPTRHGFLGTQTGILVRDGLPAEVRNAFLERKMPIAEPHWVLKPPSAANHNAYVVAAVTGIMGAMFGLASIIGLIGLRLRRTSSTPA